MSNTAHTNHHQINQQQYQDKSKAYLTSQTHAQGIEFTKMRQIISDNQLNNVLDLGCGGGHVSYQVAEVAQSVIAYDLTPEMVALVKAQAEERGLVNITTQVGCAERLPFDDGQFDAVISRYSAHHWQSITQAMLEIYRVIRPKGKVIMVDVLGNANPLLNNFLQTIETIRDPSHVKDYSLSEWLYFAEMTGFRVETIEKQTLMLDFASWVARMNTPANSRDVIRQLQQTASDTVKRYFDIQADGTFTSEVIFLVLTK